MIMAILGLITWAVARRYVAGHPLPWADELSGYLLVAMVGLGMAEALRRGDHIAIDLLTSKAKAPQQRLLAVLSAFAVLVFALILAWSAWGHIRFDYAFGSYTPGEIEVESWVPQVPLLVGWILLAIVAIGQILESLTGDPSP